MPEDKQIPLLVWIFWAAIGLLIIGLIGSAYPIVGGSLTFVISVLTAIGGAVAGTAAYLTVKEFRKDRQERHRDRRPYFSFVSGSLGVASTEDGGDCDYIDIRCKQVGINPAADLVAEVTIVRESDYGDVLKQVLADSAVNDIAAGFEFAFNQGGFWLQGRFEHYYVVVELSYKDAIYDSRFAQRIYLQWPGLELSRGSSNRLAPISKQVLPSIHRMLST